MFAIGVLLCTLPPLFRLTEGCVLKLYWGRGNNSPADTQFHSSHESKDLNDESSAAYGTFVSRSGLMRGVGEQLVNWIV
jgi:hypothetical protein